MSSLGDVFSGFAVIMAGLALLQTSRTSRVTTRLQRKILELEQAREQDRVIQSKSASLVVQPKWDTRKTLDGAYVGYHLQVFNVGQAEAREIRVIVDRQVISKFNYLGSQAAIECFVSRNTYTLEELKRLSYEVEVYWVDDLAKEKYY